MSSHKVRAVVDHAGVVEHSATFLTALKVGAGLTAGVLLVLGVAGGITLAVMGAVQ